MISQTFCSAPFKEALVDTDGHLKPCCQFKAPPSQNNFKNFNKWWEEELEDLRNDMESGKINPGCEHCQSIEVKKLKDLINKKYIEDIKKIELKHMEIRFGNYCNLKCIMCGPYASTSITEEYIKNRELYSINGFRNGGELYLKPQQWWNDVDAYDQLIKNIKDLKSLHFGGGEPLIMPELIKLLDELTPNTKISFNSNITKLSPKLLKVFEKFKEIRIFASLEGIEEHNDYIRYQSKWKEVDQNIQILKSYQNINLSIVHVLQHTSVYTLPKLIEYTKQNKLNINFNEVFSHDGKLEIHSVSPTDLEIFKEYLDANSNPALSKFLEKYQFDINKHKLFQKYVNMLDSIRNTDFRKSFNPSWIY